MCELRVEANIKNLPGVLAFIDEKLEEAGCSMKTQVQIDVAVEEIFVNIASYAYVLKPGIGDALIRVAIRQDPKRVEITFIDSGIPYNPLEKEDPDVTLSVEERRIGGLGIYMVKKSMDGMFYERKEDKNILMITKKL